MKSFLFAILFTMFFNFVYADDPESKVVISGSAKSHELVSPLSAQDEPGFFDVEFTPRKIKASILSTIVPGSGQTYLGNEIKGMALSLSFFGSALAGIIAHNNASGREDRIKVLTQEYISKGNYDDAEKVWQSILAEKSERDNDYKRRSIFSWLAVGVWIYNVIDVIFLTDDFGENEFSSNNKLFDINYFTRNDLNGIELKLTLP